MAKKTEKSETSKEILTPKRYLKSQKKNKRSREDEYLLNYLIELNKDL